MLKPETKAWVAPVFFLTSITILMIDINTPRGSADYIFYFVPVALAVYHNNQNFPYIAAAFCTVLSLIGFAISPDSDISVEITRLNRLFSIISMWVVSYQVKEIIKNRNATFTTSWIRAAMVDLTERIRGELGVKEISNRILFFLNEKIEAKISALYIKENSKDLTYLTGHAFSPEENKKNIPVGEGLVGQAVIDKKILTLSSLSSEHVKVSSSLGESTITHLSVVPLMADDDVLAVVEIAHTRGIKEYEQEILNQMMDIAGVAIRSAQHKLRLNELLHQAQQFSEELQAQQEELKVSNEELEQQTKALKATHTRLENQQAEMEQTNQQLEEQTQALESQKSLLDEKNRDLQSSKNELEAKAAELRKASQYKSEFLANMSHELRTPLNSTLILAKLLSDNKSGNLNEEQVKYADIIYNSGNDLLNLINDILDLSKVEAGKMTINPEIINLEHVINSMEQTFMPVSLEKKLEYKIEIDPTLPKEIITDRQRLEQILKNFLSNAFKFTQAGSVLFQIFPEGDQVAFAVSDTGVGITSQEQEVIFEAFRQADGTTNRKFGGTGLGLSISKELSQILGGEIKVSSIKGQGSTFTLIIPKHFKSPDVKTSSSIKIPLPKPEEIRPIQETKRLEKDQNLIQFSFKDDRDTIKNFSRIMLIIEDDEEFAKILFDLAHEMNFGAIVAPTGDQGMELAKEFIPHAIVLDIRLPDHSGMIVLDHLKMNTRTRHIPVHVISSSDFSRSALEMGAVGYMLKPVQRDKLAVAFQNMNSMLEQKVKHVLVVEDDKVQRDHIVNLISDSTVKVDAVETSREALENLSRRTYDCMIMDLSLPDMSGHELLSKLSNENSTYSFPPVIVYTARDLTVEEEERLRLYSGSIIIKGAKSPERLLSEVTLFLHRVETDLPPERQKMLSDLRSREKGLASQTILIVDDDVRNIFALTSALESYGAKIQSARNGREALEKVASEEVDLILMDIMMPEMDGYQAIRRLRSDPKYQELPIIALTAKAMKDDKEKCIEAGANDYLPKPLEVDKLLSLIRVWLPQKRRFTS